MFALTNEEIQRRCPSIFADGYHQDRTEKYEKYSTIELVDALRGEGFEVTDCFAQKSRVSGIHARHCLRLSHVDYLNETKPGEYRPEVVMVNSHDGSTTLRIMAGIFRLVCSNGCISMSSHFASEKIKHFGHTMEEAIAATIRVGLHSSTTLVDSINRMKTANLTEKQQKEMAKAAARIRFATEDDSKLENTEYLLNTRRHEDNVEPTVWNTFNVLQENCIKGGQAVSVTGRIMKPVTNVKNNILINQRLWNLAEEYTDKVLVAA